MICAPSFLSSNFSKLKQEILSINEAKWLHFDVMDGLFVSNTTYDHQMLKTIGEFSNQVFDCHLMIEKPEKYVDNYIENGADYITFHYEASHNPLKLIQYIQSKGVKAGISIKPNTRVEVLDDLLEYLDLILIMSVEPGKGGQKFIPNALDKINYLNNIRTQKKYEYLIEVDGGIQFDTAKMVKNVGCDVIVVGSFIFNQSNRNQIIKELENV
ncbi:ribulose-phosphate 3-epimerase [Hujiaoplasma nucleasis]|uniref:Ribulose-phosphate 3-epimerase n=1 Tax=Hujiaoplasma nucleasis TaxID=2725268 RepID=A0A7L6N463_9MOLU|nr:ribulose-phosphate 3-epimerase [Hujiaoplasma nucleasis]QLY39369.1 ribulose-phosphate 3-epimerase [Hujiaoplasma nucleasis]